MTNEQKYKTPEERIGAFNKHCARKDCGDCQVYKISLYPDGRLGCILRWLSLEAKEEPLTYPFCGGDNIDIFETDFGRNEEPCQFAVKCKSCGALVSAEDKAEAIAAWNRRAK